MVQNRALYVKAETSFAVDAGSSKRAVFPATRLGQLPPGAEELETEDSAGAVFEFSTPSGQVLADGKPYGGA